MSISSVLFIGLAVATWNEVVCTNSPVYCFDYSEIPWFMKYDTTDTLETFGRFCTISQRDSHNESVGLSLQNDIFPGATNDKEILILIFMNCTIKTRIYFKDYPESMNLSLKIGYLFTENCNIYWNDIDKLGRVVDLRFLVLTDRSSSFQSELDLGYFHNETKLYTLPSGLRNIDRIHMSSNKPPVPIEMVFTDYIWSLLGIFQVTNYILPSNLSILHASMPNLQQIVVNNCSITLPPGYFPWSNELLELPRGLARYPSDYINYQFSLTLPSNVHERIADYRYNHIPDLSDVTFRGRLHALYLGSNKIDAIGPSTFNQLQMVQLINLSKNRIKVIPAEAFYNLTNLKYLYLSENLVHQINAGIFFNNPSMLLLNLSYNAIELIEKNSFEDLINLYTLDLSQNCISSQTRTPFSDDNRSQLRVINISSNNLTMLPEWLFLLAHAHTIDVSDNPITWNAFRKSLASINVNTFNKQNTGPDGECYKPDGQIKMMTLRRWRKFDTIKIDEMSENERMMLVFMIHCFVLDFDESSLNCDCNMYTFYLFIRLQITDHPYLNTQFKCNTPAEFKGRPLATLEPSDLICVANISGCPRQCMCYMQLSEHQNIVDCSNRNLTSLPLQVPAYTGELLASGNNIKELKYSKQLYLTRLRVLDLSENIISKIDSNFPDAVSSIHILRLHNNKLGTLPLEVSTFSNTTLTLGGNPWKCDCNTEWMKDWIMEHRKYIDIEEMICATGEGQGQAIIDVPIEMFVCPKTTNSAALMISLITISVLSVFLIISTVLLYKYRGEIKVLLYVHFNWHPFDRIQEADVLDNQFDVFISYSSLDFRLAADILHFLESQKPPFRVCLHDRDFMVGAPIQENIMGSIRQSRRMIMILTSNYIESDWCTFEFRAAHDRVLHDHTNYLILVLAEDIPEAKLDDDLKLYIHTNTYLSFENKWFYDKLRYVLPQVPLVKLQSRRRAIALDDPTMFYDSDLETQEIVQI